MENPSASAPCYREPGNGRVGQRGQAVDAGDRALGTNQALWLVSGKLFKGPKSAFAQVQICIEREPARPATWHGPFSYHRNRASEQNQEMWFPGHSPSRIFSEPWFFPSSEWGQGHLLCCLHRGIKVQVTSFGERGT